MRDGMLRGPSPEPGWNSVFSAQQAQEILAQIDHLEGFNTQELDISSFSFSQLEAYVALELTMELGENNQWYREFLKINPDLAPDGERHLEMAMNSFGEFTERLTAAQVEALGLLFNQAYLSSVEMCGFSDASPFNSKHKVFTLYDVARGVEEEIWGKFREHCGTSVIDGLAYLSDQLEGMMEGDFLEFDDDEVLKDPDMRVLYIEALRNRCAVLASWHLNDSDTEVRVLAFRVLADTCVSSSDFRDRVFNLLESGRFLSAEEELLPYEVLRVLNNQNLSSLKPQQIETIMRFTGQEFCEEVRFFALEVLDRIFKNRDNISTLLSCPLMASTLDHSEDPNIALNWRQIRELIDLN